MYTREHDGQILTFGVSGSLWKDALVMYDHETESLWGHVIGKAIDGPLAGAQLSMYPATQTTWKAWLASQPNTRVLRKPALRGTTYHLYNADAERLGIHGRRMNRTALPPKSKVIGFVIDGTAYAIPMESLEKNSEQPIQTPDGTVLRIRTDSAGSGVSLWRSAATDKTEGSYDKRNRVITIQAIWVGWYNFHPETIILRP